MPLHTLYANDTRVNSLAPLGAAPLRLLSVRNNRSLRSLDGINTHELERIDIGGSGVTSIEPLRGAPLRFLGCSGCTLTAFAPLSGMPLEELWAASSGLDDLSALAGLPLIKLDINDNAVRSLVPLRGMHLVSLVANRNRIESLNGLKGMLSLDVLQVNQNPLNTLDPLRGLQLTDLGIEQTHVVSLEPLAGIPLRRLQLRGSPVVSLGPLEGMPLEELDCSRTGISDLGPFESSPPPIFDFENDGLGDAYVDSLARQWRRRELPGAETNLRDFAVRRAVRRGDRAAAMRSAVEHDGNRYALVMERLSWWAADSTARALGGHLVTVTDQDEYEFFVRLISVRSEATWLGLLPASGWVTGEGLSFVPEGFRLSSVPPENRVLALRTEDAQLWYDDRPSVVRVFAIEWEHGAFPIPAR
jgi:hypothetical protein